MAKRLLVWLMSARQLKKKIQKFLETENFADGLAEIGRIPARQAVGPLFSFLCSLDELLKWRAVTAMGKIISDLAANELESARVVMRRFIWNLNDESGGIGWGCPESMAEIMAQNAKLAAEYHCILVSYIQPRGNYLEHEGLQQGALWGIGRVAHRRPMCMQTAAGYLLPYLKSPAANVRGLAAWAAGPILDSQTNFQLKELAHDPAGLMLYREGRLVRYTVGRLAREALADFENGERKQKIYC